MTSASHTPDYAPPPDRAELRLTHALQNTLKQAETQPLTLGLIVETTNERAFGVLMAFLCLPFMQPIPIPGASIPFGIALTLLGLQVAFGWHKPWLPKRMMNWKLPPKTTNLFLRATAKIFRPLEKIIKPRLLFMQNRGSFFVVGLAIAIDGILLTVLPAFPGSNIIPAWMAIIKVLGLTEEDGFLLLLGTGITAGVCIFAFFGFETALGWIHPAAQATTAPAIAQ